jgi:hypothetical protein
MLFWRIASLVTQIVFGVVWVAIISRAEDSPSEPNYDESAVRPFTLPDVLADAKGVTAATPQQ